jgi:hypothetical protein
LKILYVLHNTEMPVHEHIFSFLRANDIQVDLVPLGPAPKERPWENVWLPLRKKSYIIDLNKKKYDYIISNTHSSFIKKAWSAVKPKNGFIDIEHDLFSAKPEHFDKTTVFTLQKLHTKFCNDASLPFVRCRPPKVDAPYKKEFVNIDPWREVVLVGSAIFNGNNPARNLGFDKVWYKKYLNEWDIPEGTFELPESFAGPIGFNCCMDNFKFVVTSQSSCFVEALIMGGLPILLLADVSTHESIGPILSKVNIKKKNIIDMPAIVINDIQNKISMLRESSDLFEEVRQTMLDFWMDSDYSVLPPAHEALLHFIREGK